MSISETVIPQCFAKAGKMEPNHLLNGFGPLQPAVAMLWWLQEPFLLWSLQQNHCNNSRPLNDDWLMAFPLPTTSGVFSECHIQCCTCPILTNKEINPSFKTLVWSPFLTECCLSISSRIDILTRLSRGVSKIAGGRRAACAISEIQHSHVCVRMYGCLAKTLSKLTVTGC